MFATTPTITEGQMLIIGVIAIILAQLAKIWYVKRKGEKVPSIVTTIIVFAISFLLAIVWGGIPVFAQASVDGNWFEVVNTFLKWAVNIAGFAVIIYGVLGAKLLEKAGFDQGSYIDPPNPMTPPEALR